MEQRAWFGLRDLLYLVVLALVLAAWGFDRGGLVTRLEHVAPEPLPKPGAMSSSVWLDYNYQPPPGTLRQGFQLDRF